MKRVFLQPVYVLHRRAYRETSFLLELYSLEYGRLSVIARGARKLQQGLLQPFVPLLVSWTGQTELMTLTHVEAHGEIKNLSGECLLAGLYLNELLINLLQKGDAHAQLFLVYEKTVQALQANNLQEKILRQFEIKLLEELGYSLLPKTNEKNFLPEKCYRFIHDQGFEACEGMVNQPLAANVFSGKHLLAMTRDHWQDSECLQAAKRLTRLVLTRLLGGRTLHSRRLFPSQLRGSSNT